SPASLKLRLYQTLSDIAVEKNSTIILPFPEEVLNYRKNKD
ncbi:MAG TPA: slipin family protein, partial [Candidatus Portnoybacteria bacterium]|nr:slipin family protein [Candidatus Portnoybacteria bacterium]